MGGASADARRAVAEAKPIVFHTTVMGFAKSSTHPTACALFAQYRNFEIRGGSFRDLVTALSGVKPVV